MQPPSVNSHATCMSLPAVCYVPLCELLPGVLASNTPVLYYWKWDEQPLFSNQGTEPPAARGHSCSFWQQIHGTAITRAFIFPSNPPLQIHEHVDPSCFITPDFIRISPVKVRTVFEAYSGADFKAGWGKALLEDIISSKKIRKPLSSNALVMWLSNVTVQCDCPM